MALVPPTSLAGSGGLTQLFDSTLLADTAAIDTGAAGVPQTAHHLLIVTYARTTEALITSTVVFSFNNDVGANYDMQSVRGQNVTAAAADAQASLANHALAVPGATAAASVFGAGAFLIPAYLQTVGFKAGTIVSGFADTAATGGDARAMGTQWRNTVAITRVAMTAGGGNLLTGSRMTIYGLT